MEMCLRGLLRGHGLKIGPTNRQKFDQLAREMVPNASGLEDAVDALLKARAALKEHFRRLTEFVVARACQNERAQLLTSVSGVGALI